MTAEESVGFADVAACTCEPCKRKRGLPNAVRPATIHSYSSQPRSGWVPRRMPDPADQSAPTFGIELETATPSRRIFDLPDRPYVGFLPYDASPEQVQAHNALIRERDAWIARNRAHRARQESRWADAGNMTAEEAVSMAAPRGLWHAKHDGSVSGPEFASQPATLAYWRHVQPHLHNMFRSLLHGGMRSHDGDTCGLHINIGTSAFVDPTDPTGRPDIEHLVRFATLVTMNPRWATKMAQRTHDSAAHWAPFDGLATPSRRRQWAEQIHAWGSASQGRYCVLNAGNPGRIEFRLPRGTLRLDRFYAKLEWTAAMIEYTRNPDNVVQVSAFLRWAEQTGEYPALVQFAREKFAGRFA